MSRVRKPAAPLLAQGSDWTFEELDRCDAEIGRVAAAYGLDTYPTSSRSSPPSR
jgi:spore cortex formation protein SpoVR/YcgB (stage V sporulation)